MWLKIVQTNQTITLKAAPFRTKMGHSSMETKPESLGNSWWFPWSCFPSTMCEKSDFDCHQSVLFPRKGCDGETKACRASSETKPSADGEEAKCPASWCMGAPASCFTVNVHSSCLSNRWETLTTICSHSRKASFHPSRRNDKQHFLSILQRELISPGVNTIANSSFCTTAFDLSF